MRIKPENRIAYDEKLNLSPQSITRTKDVIINLQTQTRVEVRTQTKKEG